MVSKRSVSAAGAVLAASLLLVAYVALRSSGVGGGEIGVEQEPASGPAGPAWGGEGAPAHPPTGRRALLALSSSHPPIGRRVLGANDTARPAPAVAPRAEPSQAVAGQMFTSQSWFERDIPIEAAEELRPRSCRIIDPDPCMAPIPPYKDRLSFDGTNGHMHEGGPWEKTRATHRGRILSLLTNLADIKRELGEAIAPLDRTRPVVVMPVNEGYMSLFVNFLESCKRANIKIKEQMVVFPASRALHEKVIAMGLVSFWSDALVTKRISDKAAGAYGDTTFLDMMWVKTVSVWLVLQLKRDLIFQDCDMVWLKDPVPYINDANCVHEGEDSDAIFQHDGAVSRRFAPYFACSGFFFLRSNWRVNEFWSSVLYSDLTWFWRSQQAPINYALGGSCRTGLRVNILCEETFINGKIMIGLERGKRKWEELRPVVAHVNWTLNMTDKVNRMKKLGLWLIEGDGMDGAGEGVASQ